jgi:protein-S-isoprenylcysteine O-methyltransferase Ste14
VAKLAIWMLIAFGVLTLLVRVGIQLRTTGRTGLIGLRRAGAAGRMSAVLFTGGMALGVVSIDLVLRDSLSTIGSLDVGALHAIGIALAAGAGLAVFLAQLGMGESWRIGVNEEERTDLITGGWFSVIRNPIYSAMIIGWLGFALMVPTWLGFAAPVVVAVGLELQVRLVEEPYLLRTHGEAYRDYAARVGRFVPGIGLFDVRRSS